MSEPNINDISAAEALGVLLRQAREAKSLSVGEVCERLKFPARRIEALENGNYESMPEPVFVKGFIHAYARLLELDMADVDAYLAQIFPASQRNMSPASTVSSKNLNYQGTTVRRAPPKWLLGVLVLAVIGAVVYAWQSKSSAENAKQAATASQDVAPKNEPAALSASNVRVISMPAPEVQTATASAAAADASGIQAASAVSASAGAQTLTVTVKYRSWVGVTDADRKVLSNEIVDAGQTRRFEGTPPYKVVLGYADGATVQFAGQNVDLPKHKKTTVSLTVGGK